MYSILHVGGLRPDEGYDFRTPESHNTETVWVSGDYPWKIVGEDTDEKSLDLAARFVLDKALHVRASNVVFTVA